MSIRSLDFQMLIPKSQEQSKVNQQNNDKVKVEHQQIVQQDKTHSELQFSRINKFENKNVVYNNNNNPDKRQKKHQKKKRDSNKENCKEENNEVILGSKIDIKI